MNYVNLIRKIRACEGEAAAQVILEYWVSKFTYVVGLDIGKEQDQATVVVCCKHFPEGASHVVFAEDLTASKGQFKVMDKDPQAEYERGFIDGMQEQMKRSVDRAVNAMAASAEAEKQVTYSGNGTAGRENMTAPTGFFFQMPKREWVKLADELEALFTNIDHAISSGAWNVQKGSQTWEIIEHAKAAHGIKEKNT